MTIGMLTIAIVIVAMVVYWVAKAPFTRKEWKMVARGEYPQGSLIRIFNSKRELYWFAVASALSSHISAFRRWELYKISKDLLSLWRLTYESSKSTTFKEVLIDLVIEILIELSKKIATMSDDSLPEDLACRLLEIIKPEIINLNRDKILLRGFKFETRAKELVERVLSSNQFSFACKVHAIEMFFFQIETSGYDSFPEEKVLDIVMKNISIEVFFERYGKAREFLTTAGDELKRVSCKKGSPMLKSKIEALEKILAASNSAMENVYPESEVLRDRNTFYY